MNRQQDSTVQPVEHMRLVPAKTLVAAGVRWGQPAQEDNAGSIIGSRMEQFQAAADALIEALQGHRETTPDFRHWALDLEQQIHQAIVACDFAICDDCSGVAFHLSPLPGDFSRFCRPCYSRRFQVTP